MLKLENANKYLLDVASITIIITFGVLSTFDLANYLDISFYDETNYLHRGIFFFNQHIEPENGPVYSFWYYILSKFDSNPVNLYYLNWKITIILPSIALFFALRTYGVNVCLSVLLSIFVLYAFLNYINWPRVSNFCISAILLSFIVFKKSKTNFRSFYYCSLIALFISYIRPEFFLWFIILFSSSIFIVFLEKNSMTKTEYFSLGCFFLFFIFLKLNYGLPMFEQDSFRSIIAFGQYFTVNKFIKSGNWTEDPWTNWEKHFYPVFGQVKSFGKIITNNPNAFYEHIKFNTYNYFKNIYFTVPDYISPKWFLNIKIVLSVPIIVFTIIGFLKRKEILYKLKCIGWKQLIFQLIPFISFLIPVLISCIILFPREHYYYMFNVIAVLVFGVLVNFIFKEHLQLVPKIAVYTFFLSLIFYLVYLNIQPKNYYPLKSNIPNKNTYEYISKFKIMEKINLLENEGGLSVFLGNNYSWIPGWTKNVNFKAYLEDNKVNMIWVTNSLLEDSRLKNDLEWQDFILNYKIYNFVKITNKSIKGYFLFSRELQNK